jgi:steroid 5-alpha reductase family enzyme
MAIFAGLITYVLTPVDNFWLKLLIADVLATIVIFIFSLIFKNASVYDPYWSVQPIVIIVYFAIYNGLNLLTALLLVIVCIWGIRLTLNWAYTFKGIEHQDWRYTMLNEVTGKFYPIINFLGIHMFPTIVVYFVVLPVVFAIKTAVSFNYFSIIFMAISLFAITIQGISDCQMHSFRKNRTSTFIRVGLWKHSRHPNYLGEILMWWGVALAVAISAPNLWYLCFGALLNTIMFLVISIPMADKRQSKKEGFAEYKKQTHMLLPIKKFNTK